MYFPPRPTYYSGSMDGCIIMPEAPPFPFNSAGTLYICPPTLTSVSRSNRSSSFQQATRRNENENSTSNLDTTMNSSSTTTSKDSNDESSINETTTPVSIDDNQTSNYSCSIADAPVSLVTNADQRDRSSSTESVTSSKSAEQPLTTEDEKQEQNSV